MAVNLYFERLEAHNEHTLMRDLVIEDIQISGFDITYIHRSEYDLDKVFTEARASKFKDAFVIEASISDNVMGWGGEAEIMNQFGLHIDNSGTFKISQHRWKQIMEARAREGKKVLDRPMEGDLIYFGYGHATFTNSLFIINHVDFSDTNWQHGRAFLYRLKVTQYNPNTNELIQTDEPIHALDSQFDAIFDTMDKTSQNRPIQDNADTLAVFDETNVFGGT